MRCNLGTSLYTETAENQTMALHVESKSSLSSVRSLTGHGRSLAPLQPLLIGRGWQRHHVLLPACRMCQAERPQLLKFCGNNGTAGLVASLGREQKQQRGATAVVCAGGPSGGLQRVKRVRSGEVQMLSSGWTLCQQLGNLHTRQVETGQLTHLACRWTRLAKRCLWGQQSPMWPWYCWYLSSMSSSRYAILESPSHQISPICIMHFTMHLFSSASHPLPAGFCGTVHDRVSDVAAGLWQRDWAIL